MAENASLSNKSIFFELIEGNAEDSPGDSEPGSDIDFEDYNDNSFMPNFNELDNENGGRDADHFSHNELIETFAHVRVDTDAVDEPHGKVIVLDHPDDGWKNEITRPQEKRFKIANQCGPKVTLDGLDETELFQLFFDAPVFEHIVRETNRNYAAQPDKHKSTWTDLTVGVGFAKRKLGNSTTPTLEVTKDGDNVLIKTVTAFKTYEQKFTLGVEFDEKSLDDLDVKSLITLEGDNVFKQVQQRPDGETEIIREFSDKEIKATFKCGDVVATRIYTRTSSI